MRLARHPFPGNVRELRNVLERAALLTDGDVIGEAEIERALAVGLRVMPTRPSTDAAAAASATPRTARREAERAALEAALAGHRGSREELARALGISLRTLYRRMETLHPRS